MSLHANNLKQCLKKMPEDSEGSAEQRLCGCGRIYPGLTAFILFALQLLGKETPRSGSWGNPTGFFSSGIQQAFQLLATPALE